MNRRSFVATLGAVATAGCTGLNDGSDGSADDPAANESTGSGDGTTERGDAEYVKVDLHSHLRIGGGQAMADRYAELGFGALVGTDHHDDVGVPGDRNSEQVADYSDLEFPGPILDGVELSEGHHVNVIESESEQIKQVNHPMVYDADEEDVRELAEEIGADLVEVTNDASALEEYPTVTEAVEDLDLHPTATSDAHEPGAIGEAYVVVEVPEVTGDEVVRALRRGDFSLGGEKLW